MKMKRVIANCILKFFWIIPIKKKQILFCSYDGKKIGDSPYELFLQFQKDIKGYKFIWVVEDYSNIEGVKSVKKGGIKECYYLATSALWIDNFRKREWVRKRKGQIYIQTWHDGGFPLKKVELDAKEKLTEDYIRRAKNDSKMADVFISGCRMRTEQYRRAFWFDKTILEYGTPSSDIFYSQDKIYKDRLCEWLGFDASTKILLYAPTFRVNGSDCYDIDYERLVNSLNGRWSGNWVVLVRMHPLFTNVVRGVDNNIVYNVSDWPQINELIMASDVIISDYSGVIGAGLEANKYVMLYASDYDFYKEERDTYLQFEDMPFPYAYDNDQLNNNVATFDEIEYREKVMAFRNKCGYYEGGNATKRCAEYIYKMMGLK